MGKVVTFRIGIRPLGQSPRKIWVYLPDGYADSDQTYPVLYMFDGHNLFFDSTATYGKCWGIKDYLDAQHLDLIVVGQDCNHTGDERINEYLPLAPDSRREFASFHAQGDFTAKWFAGKLKPAVERKFRVRSDRKYTGIGGSSMGGLMSDYMACTYSDVFSRFASISPATEFCYGKCLDLVKSSDIHKHTRLYRSLGTLEYKPRRVEMAWLEALSYVSNAFLDQGCEVHTRIYAGGRHCEECWEHIVPEFLHYLYPEIYE